MEFINIAREQLKDKEKPEKIFFKYPDFFEEYFSVFEDKEQFQKNIRSILAEIDCQQTQENINILKKHLSKIVPTILSISNDLIYPNIIFFIGTGSWDGHGIIVNKKPFTFFDMTLMNRWVAHSTFALQPHLIHEVFHALHYYYSPDFYLRNYGTVEGIYLKRMIAEGMATYLAERVTKVGFFKAFWLGLLDDKLVERWIEICENSKKSIWDSIKKAVANNRENKTLENTLFSVIGFTEELLIKGRLGYYFGTKIVEKAAKDVGETAVLYLDFPAFRKYVEQYFENS